MIPLFSPTVTATAWEKMKLRSQEIEDAAAVYRLVMNVVQNLNNPNVKTNAPAPCSTEHVVFVTGPHAEP